MKKKTIIRVILIALVICGIHRCHKSIFFNKATYINTFNLGNRIFEEKFQPFSGGVLMSDTYSYYLTDSTKFRTLLGQCDEKEVYRCIVKGDSIKAIKYSRRIKYGKEIPIDSFSYSISNLKNEGKFE